jgi:salicylate hydroxylase
VLALTDAEPQAGRLLIAADGVWSALRRQVRAEARSAFSGHIAWRATLASSAPAVAGIAGDRVTVFLHHRFHLVAYPLRGGSLVNLVAVIAGAPVAETWENPPEGDPLESAFAGTRIDGLAGAAAWTVWPLHEVDSSGSWTSEAGIVLAGDAAHAMTPFAAQGAAMAIEDGLVLAECLAQHGTADPIGAARRYEAIRRPRVARVARRSAFNRFAWHAAGPVALARDLVLAARSGTGLMRDLDWLYGFNAGSEPGQA